MAAVAIATRDPHELEDTLCSTCWTAALKRYQVWRLDLPGMTYIGTRIWCRDEKAWKTPLDKETPL